MPENDLRPSFFPDMSSSHQGLDLNDFPYLDFWKSVVLKVLEGPELPFGFGVRVLPSLLVWVVVLLPEIRLRIIWLLSRRVIAKGFPLLVWGLLKVNELIILSRIVGLELAHTSISVHILCLSSTTVRVVTYITDVCKCRVPGID
jgi:hypothetical protein